MCFDGELFLAVWDGPELDEAAPGCCGQSPAIWGKLAGGAGPVISQLTALVYHLHKQPSPVSTSNLTMFIAYR